MAKISPTSIKYNITADFKSEGPVEKPDVIGALFGQTEGLLGSELELRELQKEGKIGRIDVDLITEGGKTTGEITIPSALDKTETTIVAAALETIDKIGPTDAKITIKEIYDVRGTKRDYIMERAKQLLSGINNVKDSIEIEQELRESTRVSKISEYGEERLPAGDLSSNEIIVVEGRADVVNMLKHGIKNVIGMNGTKLPAEIARLGEKKELTLFVDGDRGGKLIAQNVSDNAKIAFIAIAPDGKEVEELAGKEILQSLRKKVSISEYFRKPERTGFYERNERPREERFERNERPREERFERNDRQPEETEKVEARELTREDKEKLRELVEELRGRNVLILNTNLEVIKDIPISKLGFMKVYGAFILLTVNATKTVISDAEKLGAKYVAAKTFGKLEDTNIKLVSL
ncbi:MAG: DNA primase DnaG [Nanoarchaeota archaeon]|nr:DNA primase DnaG [Nanoarchaeota archaeon]